MSSPLRVLVAENDPEARRVLSQILQASGYRVELAEHGKDATQKAASIRYDLILSDLEMPHSDGVSVASEIRAAEKRDGREPTPMIGLAAQDSAAMRDRVRAAAMNALVTKPVRSEALLDAVREWVDDRSSVLVVDDAEQNRALLTTWLATRPHTRVIAVERAGAALASVRRERIDLILLDMVMPGIDGYAAARLLRALPDGREVPIIAITAKVGADERAACLAAGCTEYLAKPLTKPALLAMVDLHARPSSSTPTRATRAQATAPKVGAVDEAAGELDEDTVALVPAFLENRRSEMSVLRAALAKQAFQEIVFIGHNLRGSGGSYGFPLLSEIGAFMEDSAKARDAAGVFAAIERFCAQMAEIDRSRQA